MRFAQMIPNRAKIVLAKTSVWKRVAAFLIDMFIINSFLLIPFKKFFAMVPSQANIASAYSLLAYPWMRDYITKLTLFISLVAFIYFVIFENSLNQTLGKMLFNIYVIPAAAGEKELREKGPKIGFWKAAIRNLFIFPFFPFILLWIIDPINMLLSRDQQRFSEVITGTRTVEKYIKE